MQIHCYLFQSTLDKPCRVHIASLARRVNVAPSHLRAICKHRNAVIVAIAVTVITVFVCVWIFCTIVHAP